MEVKPIGCRPEGAMTGPLCGYPEVMAAQSKLIGNAGILCVKMEPWVLPRISLNDEDLKVRGPARIVCVTGPSRRQHYQLCVD